VDESNAGSLVLLRRTLFKFKGVSNRMDFSNEPYICGEAVEGAAPLLRASWTSQRYLVMPVAPSAWNTAGSWQWRLDLDGTAAGPHQSSS
jgi:hypothetical protein